MLRFYRFNNTGITINTYSRRFFSEKATETKNQKITYFKKIIHDYREGLRIGLGVFTIMGISTYFLWPRIHNYILKDDKMQQNATELTKNVTGDLINDEKTQEQLRRMIIDNLKHPDVVKAVTDVLEESAAEALQRESFQIVAADAAKKAVWKMVW
jgi:hypothetical protein